MPQRSSSRRTLGLVALGSAASMAVLTLTGAPASAANVVNATIHTPADVATNPCFPEDRVNLNGNIHVVITSTVDKSGTVHATSMLNSHLSGVSITTGTKYQSSENSHDVWSAPSGSSAPHATISRYRLVSQGGTANYVLTTTLSTVIAADGTATIVAENWQIDCTG